jgi:prophage maintenance system killer protein
LARGIICGHAFLDGNKRTGLTVAYRFLKRNGWVLELDDDALVSLALDITGDRAKGKEPLSVPEITERLRAASAPIESSF